MAESKTWTIGRRHQLGASPFTVPVLVRRWRPISWRRCNDTLMPWAGLTVAIVESDEQPLLDLAAERALDLVLCWRASELRPAKSLSLAQRLSVHRIELLAVAQSCTALME